MKGKGNRIKETRKKEGMLSINGRIFCHDYDTRGDSIGREKCDASKPAFKSTSPVELICSRINFLLSPLAVF
jgi:hypothetical protein